jgi:ribosomal protein S18 acetylase RimI-like enzyme
MTPTSSSPQPVIGIHSAEAADLPTLEPLWLELYTHQSEHGMLLQIPSDGYMQWSQSFSSVLGRFAAIFRATADGAPVGFLACRVRSLPAYLGGFLVGFISEVYVRKAYRRQGAGRRLLDAALGWFAEQDIRRVELQVLASNTAAIDAYRRLGWQPELYQMVWQQAGV